MYEIQFCNKDHWAVFIHIYFCTSAARRQEIGLYQNHSRVYEKNPPWSGSRARNFLYDNADIHINHVTAKNKWEYNIALMYYLLFGLWNRSREVSVYLHANDSHTSLFLDATTSTKVTTWFKSAPCKLL